MQSEDMNCHGTDIFSSVSSSGYDSLRRPLASWNVSRGGQPGWRKFWKPATLADDVGYIYSGEDL